MPPALIPYMAQMAQREGIKYLWLDWSCAPQYPVNDPSATMREINRSGKYYASARFFCLFAVCVLAKHLISPQVCLFFVCSLMLFFVR